MYDRIKRIFSDSDNIIKRNIKVIATFVISVMLSSFCGYKNSYIWPLATLLSIGILLIIWKKIENKRIYIFLIAILIGTSCFFIHTELVYNRAIEFEGQAPTISGVVDDKTKYDDQNICYNLKVSNIDNKKFIPSFIIRINTKSELNCEYGDKITFSFN